MTSPARKVVDRLLTKYPKTGTATLARMAYDKSPELWPSNEACRSMFRRARGNMGARHRTEGDKTHFRPNGSPENNPFGEIPKGKVELKAWNAVNVKGPCKALVLCDIHSPYHDEKAVEIALRAGLDEGCDKVILLGDVQDNYAASKWQTDPRERDYPAEIDTTKRLLALITQAFPDADRYFKFGNHDERLEAYLIAKAPELLDLECLALENLLGLEDLGYQPVKDMKPMRLGKLYAIHGHEYKGMFSNPVNPARGLYLRAKVHSCEGHFHQTSQHSEKGLDDSVVSCWSFGCLCNMRPRYRPLNKWNQGYGIVEVAKNGAFQVENRRIIDGGSWS